MKRVQKAGFERKQSCLLSLLYYCHLKRLQTFFQSLLSFLPFSLLLYEPVQIPFSLSSSCFHINIQICPSPGQIYKLRSSEIHFYKRFKDGRRSSPSPIAPAQKAHGSGKATDKWVRNEGRRKQPVALQSSLLVRQLSPPSPQCPRTFLCFPLSIWPYPGLRFNYL